MRLKCIYLFFFCFVFCGEEGENLRQNIPFSFHQSKFQKSSETALFWMRNFSKWETLPDVHTLKKPFSLKREALRKIFHLAVKINHWVLLPLTDEIYRCRVDDLWRGTHKDAFSTAPTKAKVLDFSPAGAEHWCSVDAISAVSHRSRWESDLWVPFLYTGCRFALLLITQAHSGMMGGCRVRHPGVPSPMAPHPDRAVAAPLVFQSQASKTRVPGGESPPRSTLTK